MRIAEQLWRGHALRAAIVAAADEVVAADDVSRVDERAQFGSRARWRSLAFACNIPYQRTYESELSSAADAVRLGRLGS